MSEDKMDKAMPGTQLTGFFAAGDTVKSILQNVKNHPDMREHYTPCSKSFVQVIGDNAADFHTKQILKYMQQYANPFQPSVNEIVEELEHVCDELEEARAENQKLAQEVQLEQKKNIISMTQMQVTINKLLEQNALLAKEIGHLREELETEQKEKNKNSSRPFSPNFSARSTLGLAGAYEDRK